MARRCTNCDYTTADPFQGKCPWCQAPLAIVTAAGNRPRERPAPRPRPSRLPQLHAVPGGWWTAVLVVGLLGAILLTLRPPGNGPRAARGAAPGRVKVGMPLREAVLALEPTPSDKGVVSLHDLLDAGTDTASGAFTWSDGGPTVRVTFRRGKVTGVSEVGNRFRTGERHVDIQLSPEDAP